MAHAEEGAQVADVGLSYGAGGSGDAVKGSSADDQRDMARMGKEQEVRRDFRTVSMFGFSMILMCSWEGILSTAAIGLGNGGSAGVLYTNLATWLGFIAVYASLGEMGSMMPTSGGQYRSSNPDINPLILPLTPAQTGPRYQRFLSYVVGWLGVLGWQVGVAFSGFLVGTQIQGLLALNHEWYTYERWHGTLLILAMLLFSVLFNTLLAHQLPLLEYVVLAIHLLGFLCILIPLWALSPKTPSTEVWTSFNDPGWGSQGLSTLIGIVASVAPLLGADAAAHMAEELVNASFTLPRILLWATVVNGAMAFVMLVTFCYCIGDLESVLSTPTGYPFIQVFYKSTQSLPAANAMTSLIIILSACSNITVMAGSSRQLFAFARDSGVPFASWVAYVRPRSNVPVNAIIVSFVVAVIIALINVGSTVAFNSVTSLGTGTLTISYIISISCMIWRKLSGRPLLPSHFDMGRRFGLAVNFVALAFMCLVFVIAFFPPVPLPLLTVVSMNWSILIFGVVVLFSMGYYVIFGRKQYVGPVAFVRRLE
ncbi:hypothetical protein LTR27_001392 [Elasticomyces elasticus]|nr:hypothetical protein LTR27_001392 [Elasticomyces elasticus]